MSKKIYECPSCGCTDFTVSFTGFFSATVTEKNGRLYGEREIYAFDGSDNEIYCAECCKPITKDVNW